MRRKAKYLFFSLTIFLDQKEADPSLTWKKACYLAIEKIKDYESADLYGDTNRNTCLYVTPKTVMHQWFQNFRDNKESFINIPFCTIQITTKYPTIVACIFLNKMCMI